MPASTSLLWTTIAQVTVSTAMKAHEVSRSTQIECTNFGKSHHRATGTANEKAGKTDSVRKRGRPKKDVAIMESSAAAGTEELTVVLPQLTHSVIYHIYYRAGKHDSTVHQLNHQHLKDKAQASAYLPASLGGIFPLCRFNISSQSIFFLDYRGTCLRIASVRDCCLSHVSLFK